MSNDNLYGHTDRRLRLPAKAIHASDSIDMICRQHGCAYRGNSRERNQLESEAYCSVLNELPEEERLAIEKYKAKLVAACKGTQFGDVSAEMVLFRLGVYLALAEKL